MKILNTEQTRAADAFTIANEPIASIDLMERAALAFCKWYTTHFSPRKKLAIVCGRGNNGGDGLAISRILHDRGYDSTTYVVELNKDGSDDFETNKRRLSDLTTIHDLSAETNLKSLKNYDVIIEGLFGTGLSRVVEGFYASVIDSINGSSAQVISIDVPSGLFADQYQEGGAIVEAEYTLSFQLPKLAFLLPQNQNYVGNWKIVDIGLDQNFIHSQDTAYEFTSVQEATSLLHIRSRFSHKGTYGRALLIAGSRGKMGAAILASRAALRSGLGLLTVQTPACGYSIIQTAVPEAMAEMDENEDFISESLEYNSYDAIGCGPGIGTQDETLGVLKRLLAVADKPVVLDADALNLIAEHRELLHSLPKHSILTPHPGEFQRLVGEWKSDYEKLEKLRAFSASYEVVVVLKGAFTAVALPDGQIKFNSSGNPGMATGGSGDVLTGVITALLAQGYTPYISAILGVYLHGAAGDLACEKKGEEGLIASDIVENIPKSIKNLK